MHSPVGISVGANREGKVLATLAHLRGNARKISANTCYLGQVIDGSNNDLNFTFIRYFDNKDIILLRFMVISIGQSNGAVFSFPHLFAQASPPAGHNKNIYITSP